MFLFELFFLLLAGAHGLDETCNGSKDCQIKNSICKEQKCICDDLYYLNGSQCLPYVTEYKEYCEEKQQCEWLGEKSDCIKHKCACEKSHRWFQGKCRKYVNKGENCKDAIDCYDGQDLQSLTCRSGKCICSTGYYDRGGDCRRKSKIFRECALDQDCNGKHCKRGKCHIINKPPVATAVAENGNNSFSTSLNDKVSIEISDAPSCEFDNDCREIVNSLCNSKTHTCACPENTYLDNRICVPVTTSLTYFNCCLWHKSSNKSIQVTSQITLCTLGSYTLLGILPHEPEIKDNLESLEIESGENNIIPIDL